MDRIFFVHFFEFLNNFGKFLPFFSSNYACRTRKTIFERQTFFSLFRDDLPSPHHPPFCLSLILYLSLCPPFDFSLCVLSSLSIRFSPLFLVASVLSPHDSWQAKKTKNFPSPRIPFFPHLHSFSEFHLFFFLFAVRFLPLLPSPFPPTYIFHQLKYLFSGFGGLEYLNRQDGGGSAPQEGRGQRCVSWPYFFQLCWKRMKRRRKERIIHQKNWKRGERETLPFPPLHTIIASYAK